MKPLNPVMAALLAAASATFASPGLAHAAKARPPKTPAGATRAPAADCLKALDDAGTDSVNALTCLVEKKPEARRDIGERLASLLQGKDPGRQYVADDLLKDETLMKGVLAVAREWPEKNAKTPAKVAVLYFVVGPETAELPAWAQVAALKTKFKPKMLWSDRFAEMMTSRHWSDAKQIKPSDAANSAVAFLEDAAAQAKAVLDDPRTKKAVEDSIAANETTGTVAPTVSGDGAPRNPLDGTGSGFGFEDLYVTGAEVRDVYGAKDDGFRRISMKIYSSRDANGNPINRIGIVDITPGDRDTPTGVRYLDISHTSKQTITFREGGRPYTVEVKPNGDVSLAREGMDGGATMTTTIQTLMDDRNRQIMASGTVKIPEKDGRTYYVLGQGGAKGSVMFFPADDVRADPHGEAHPALMGDISQVIGDGSTAPVSGKPDLGKLRNGDGYHLEYDERTHGWAVKPGPGDPPPTAKKDEPAAKPGQTPGGTTAPGGAADASTLEQAIALAKASGWVESDELNSGFSPEARAKIRLMTSDNAGKTGFNAVFDPSMKVPGNQSPIIIPSMELKNVRGLGDLVILTFPTMSQYYDYNAFAKFLVGDKTAQPRYIWTAESGVQDADSVELMLDMFAHHYPKVDPKLEGTVRQRIAKYAPSGGYHLSGKPVRVNLKVGDDVTREIWPRDIPKPSETGSNAGLTQQKGPGTVYTLAGGPDNGPFPASVSDGNWTRAQADEKSGIALYSGEETSLDGKGGSIQRKRWAIMVRYQKDSGTSRSKLITIFGEGADPDYFAKPKDLNMAGLAGQKLGDTAVLRMFTDSSDEGGGVAAYRNPSSAANARDPKANCVGPVLWWGNLTKALAQTACETDGKAD
ncbi:MAG: hypothetical protein HY079_03655 [Elusimicrobia bacterium]|nr:hypothetical protein [Elusimicrobiota bacterium]